jgi:rhodanese-related sulfurtransferase
MKPVQTRMTLIGVALALGVASAALGSRAASRSSSAVPAAAPTMLEPFAVAELLAEAPPDVVVVSLDAAKHPLRGAMPIASLAQSDEAFVDGAPKARRIVLAGADAVRVDRLARRLLAEGRDVRVLAGGVEAWDHAMDADPPAPPSGATSADWQTYRTRVALRRSFGEAPAAPAAPVAAPVAPAAAPAGGAPKKREGC